MRAKTATAQLVSGESASIDLPGPGENRYWLSPAVRSVSPITSTPPPGEALGRMTRDDSS